MKLTGKRILIVDDDAAHRLLLTTTLQSADALTEEAADGEAGATLAESKPFDLVLMDEVMPRLSGLQALTRIRGRYNPIELPIIMMTSKSDADDIIGALRAGANDYLVKPVNLEVTISRIQTQLRLSEFSREMGALKEMAALHSMVVTYNHEINTPLAAATLGLDMLKNQDDPSLTTLRKSLQRITDIVKKIEQVTQERNVEYAAYGSVKMIKLKGSGD